MERLTESVKNKDNNRWFKRCKGCKENCYYCTIQQSANEKLAAYEDAEEQCIIPKEIADLIHGRRASNERGC